MARNNKTNSGARLRVIQRNLPKKRHSEKQNKDLLEAFEIHITKRPKKNECEKIAKRLDIGGYRRAWKVKGEEKSRYVHAWERVENFFEEKRRPRNANGSRKEGKRARKDRLEREKNPAGGN